MGLFHSFFRHCEEENEWLKKLVDIQAEIILNLSKPKPRQVRLIITFNNNLNSNSMSLELKTGQSSVGTLSLAYADDPTNTPIPGVTFQNLTAVSDNPGVAAVTPNSDGTVGATGISPGVANADINAIGNFSDSSGARSEAVSAVEIISVDAPPPPPRPVKLLVSWSTPV